MKKKSEAATLIEKIQRERGMTQEEIAQRLDVSQVAVNRWLNKNVKPHKVFLRLLRELEKANE